MKKNIIMSFLVWALSGCIVHNLEQEEMHQRLIIELEQEKLSVDVINFLKTLKNFDKTEMILDSVSLVDTIFVTTSDTTLCSKKYLFYNNVLVPTTLTSPCDYSKPRRMCLTINYELISSRNIIEFKFYKQTEKIIEGYFHYIDKNGKPQFFDLFFKNRIVDLR
jgi:hypothetical protein